VQKSLTSTVNVTETRTHDSYEVKDLCVYTEVDNSMNSAIGDLGILISGSVQPKLNVSTLLKIKI